MYNKIQKIAIISFVIFIPTFIIAVSRGFFCKDNIIIQLIYSIPLIISAVCLGLSLIVTEICTQKKRYYSSDYDLEKFARDHNIEPDIAHILPDVPNYSYIEVRTFFKKKEYYYYKEVPDESLDTNELKDYKRKG